MIEQFAIQLFVLAVVVILYAAFDVFNNRNVPNILAYASVLAGLMLTFVYGRGELLFSLSIALLLGAFGYLIYRMGMWGAGDYFELVAISLILPVQSAPLLASVYQFNFPFILSVFIATGFVAIWAVPLYYLLFVKRRWSRKPDAQHIAYAIALLAMYLILFGSVYLFYGYSPARLALMFFVAVPSAITLLFENEITTRMIERVSTKTLEEGDIIAFNMMSRSERRYFAKYQGFGRLATKQLIARLRNAKRKLPVYKNAAPLAVFMLTGVIISLLFGNVVLFII